MNNNNARNMWRYIPTQRRIEIAKAIQEMPEGLNKDVLYLCFGLDMSPRTASQYAKRTNSCIGRYGKPIGTRRIEQICKQYFPDCYDYSPITEKLRETRRRRRPYLVKRDEIIAQNPCCEMCGSKENLEIHHHIPISQNGENTLGNMFVLCWTCHQFVEKYRRLAKKKAKENNTNEHFSSNSNFNGADSARS